nr:RecName: Full=Uncharacterized protein SMPP1 [Nautilus macromphalus]
SDCACLHALGHVAR